MTNYIISMLKNIIKCCEILTLIGNIARFYLFKELRNWSIFYFDAKLDSLSALCEVVSKILK